LLSQLKLTHLKIKL